MRQFAFHLARTVARTVDVDGMLEGMDPGMFSQWLEYYQLQPWGDDWEQAAVISSTVRNGIREALYSHANETMKKEDYCSADDFVPRRKKAKKKKSIKSNMQEFAANMQSRIGV